MDLDNILINLRKANLAITEAITAIESIGWIPIPTAPDYEYNGREIRHRCKDGRIKSIRLVHNRFSAHRRAYYVPADGGEPVLCK